MLPRKLYELLPYLYIVTGIVSTSLIDSTIVLISSILLIATGVFVLLMRRSYRKSLKRKLRVDQVVTKPAVTDNFVQRSGIERRCRTTTVWPILDDAGNRIVSDRRTGERRISVS
jgi:type II secretory pathway component PulF